METPPSPLARLEPPRPSSIDSAAMTLIVVLLISCVLHAVFSRARQYRTDTLYGRANGCQLPPELSKRWPLGIDRIIELWQSDSEGHLLAHLCSVAAKEYEPGNNGYQYLLFGPRTFHVLHPKNVEVLLSTNFKGVLWLGARPSVFATLLGNGIFTQDGVAWKHSRELLRKQFARAQHRDLHHFHDHVSNMIACMPKDGTVDLQPLFFNLTLDIATELLFGKSVYSLRAGIDQAEGNRGFAANFNLAQEGLAKRFRLVPFHFLYNPPSFWKACHGVHQFLEQYIQEGGFTRNSLSQSEEEHGSASWFIRQLAEKSGSKTDIRNQLLNVLLAGRDTTACCLSWTFRLLVRHPDRMTRLRHEIKEVMSDETNPTREQIRRMHFLTCLIKESLRLYPPVPLNNREAVRTTILPTGGGAGGTSPILVRKGEVVRLLQNFPIIELPEGERIEPVGTERQKLTLVLSSADGCRMRVSQNGPAEDI
ncbi:cytochrome P450 [Podospora aff. communis PSN243]|uniref:Cytochrome P450 n=1 Tax=Podospora aff. communis PSN243 TaxID=3040156 RepID=A0AAV9GVD3_9PEZI|nr:cytochrome P450 [Podospora aff. communis PSN243]